MRGHDKIIEARIAGSTPSIVFLNDYPCKTDWFDFSDYSTICTAGDPVTSLDLRFLIGLTVSISATSEQRAKALFDRVKQAGAKVVAACHIQNTHHTAQTGWFEIYRKELIYG